MASTEHRVAARKPVAGDEQGFVLVLALFILVILSIMGGAAMTLRNTEMAIATNTEVMKTNFYALEAVTLEGVTEIENAVDEDLRDDPKKLVSAAKYPWLRSNDPDDPPVIDLSQNNQWDRLTAPIRPQETSLNIKPANYAPDNTANGDRIWYAGVEGNLASDSMSYDICAGSDLSDPTKVEKCYSVHGMYDVKSGAGKAYAGKRMLMVGYKKIVYEEN